MATDAGSAVSPRSAGPGSGPWPHGRTFIVRRRRQPPVGCRRLPHRGVLFGRLTGEAPAPPASFPYPAASEADRKFLADVAAKALASKDAGVDRDSRPASLRSDSSNLDQGLWTSESDGGSPADRGNSLTPTSRGGQRPLPRPPSSPYPAAWRFARRPLILPITSATCASTTSPAIVNRRSAAPPAAS